MTIDRQELADIERRYAYNRLQAALALQVLEDPTQHRARVFEITHRVLAELRAKAWLAVAEANVIAAAHPESDEAQIRLRILTDASSWLNDYSRVSY